MSEAKWTIEKHGSGFALYSGRSGIAHGLNLFNISEVDRNFQKVKSMIEAAPEMYEEILSDISWLEQMKSKFVVGSYEFRSICLRIEVKQEILTKARGES